MQRRRGFLPRGDEAAHLPGDGHEASVTRICTVVVVRDEARRRGTMVVETRMGVGTLLVAGPVEPELERAVICYNRQTLSMRV